MDFHPDHITLSVDHRFSAPIAQASAHWHLSWQGGQHNLLNLQTSWSEHALQLQQFPRFVAGSKTIQETHQFYQSFQIESCFTNYACIICQPWKSIQCKIDYLVYDHQTLLCRFYITNLHFDPFLFALDWVFKLPSYFHKEFLYQKNRKTQCIQIHMDTATITTSMPGLAKQESGFMAHINHGIQLNPQESVQILATSLITPPKITEHSSFPSVNPGTMDERINHIKMENHADLIHFSTGNSEWDTVLRVSQQHTQRHLSSIENKLLLFQKEKVEDLSPIIFFDLIPLAFAAAWQEPQRMKNILLQYLLLPQEENFVMWSFPLPHKVLSGLALPFMAEIATNLSRFTTDDQWLKSIYKMILRNTLAWFTDRYDKDQDGCPEWHNAYQAGFDESIIHNQFPEELHPNHFAKLEHPGLIFFLLNEIRCLSKIAIKIDAKDQQYLQEKSTLLEEHLKRLWSRYKKHYIALDYETHKNSKSKLIAKGCGEIHYDRGISFPQPVRLQIMLYFQQGYTRPVHGVITGRGKNGEIREAINYAQFVWQKDRATLLSNQVYTQVDEIMCSGIQIQEHWMIRVHTIAYEDIAMLLPLITHGNKTKPAKSIVENPVFHDWLDQYGIPWIRVNEKQADQNPTSLTWQSILLWACLKTGDIPAAQAIFEKIISAASRQLQQNSEFNAYYDCLHGNMSGPVGSVRGILPIQLVMNLLGIDFFTNDTIVITHFNPYPQPITVQYRGIKLTLKKDCVEVQYRGLIEVITEPGKYRMSFSMNVVK